MNTMRTLFLMTGISILCSSLVIAKSTKITNQADHAVWIAVYRQKEDGVFQRSSAIKQVLPEKSMSFGGVKDSADYFFFGSFSKEKLTAKMELGADPVLVERIVKIDEVHVIPAEVVRTLQALAAVEAPAQEPEVAVVTVEEQVIEAIAPEAAAPVASVVTEEAITPEETAAPTEQAAPLEPIIYESQVPAIEEVIAPAEAAPVAAAAPSEPRPYHEVFFQAVQTLLLNSMDRRTR